MTDPLVERVAQALRDEWFESEASDDFRGLARAAIAAIREAEPPLGRRPRLALHDDGLTVSIGFADTNDTLVSLGEGYHPEIDRNRGDMLRLREWVAAVCALIDAEPLTSTPEPSTTETGPKANIPEQCGCASGYCPMCREDARHQDSPLGFEWEYRVVTRTVTREAPITAWAASEPWTQMTARKYGRTAQVERRLVGKPERMGEEP